MKFNKRKFLLTAFFSWPYLFYLVIIVEKNFVTWRRGVLKNGQNCHSPEEPKETWPLSAMWYLGWDLGTEKKKMLDEN